MDVAAVVARFKPDDRVTVRHRLADGSATDVVGWITAIDAERIEILSPIDRITTVERNRIILARRVPPAMGGRPPSRVSGPCDRPTASAAARTPVWRLVIRESATSRRRS
jgi:hypothetical protein